MVYLYILTDNVRIHESSFKIGVTSNANIEKLRGRYRTYDDPIVLNFIYLDTPNKFYHETLIKKSLREGREIHDETITEWIQIRYDSLVLVIKAIIMLNRVIKIHPDHFIMDNINLTINPRFLEIPVRFRRKILEPESLDNFEPQNNEIFKLLVSPVKADALDFDEYFLNKDIFSIHGYFFMYEKKFREQNYDLVSIINNPLITLDQRNDFIIEIRNSGNYYIDETLPRDINGLWIWFIYIQNVLASLNNDFNILVTRLSEMVKIMENYSTNPQIDINLFSEPISINFVCGQLEQNHTDRMLIFKILKIICGRVSNKDACTLIQPSNVSIQPSNASIQPDNISIQTSNASIQPSNVSVQPDNISIQPSNASIQPSNVSIQPDNISIQPSNVSIRASNNFVHINNMYISNTQQNNNFQSKRKSQQNSLFINQKDAFVRTNDKYFYVRLFADRDDGPDDHIVVELIKNFSGMFPNSFPAKAFCYSIGSSKDNVPNLYGLIRYDSKGKYRISTKSTHIRNNICSMYTNQRTLRDYDVQTLTKYSDKQYKTLVKDIKEKYDNISQMGRVKGATIETYLAPDERF